MGKASSGYRPVSLSHNAGKPIRLLVADSTGLEVVDADGSGIGAVDEVLGDDTVDIFDGLAVATSAPRHRGMSLPSRSKYQDGVAHRTIMHEQAGQLGEFLEPATSAEIEPDSRGGVEGGLSADARELEGKVLGPLEDHEQPMNIWRRLAVRPPRATLATRWGSFPE